MLDIKKMLAKLLKCDHVIAEGASGEWSYRKWSNGRIEAWATHAFGSQTGTAWGSQYYKDVTLPLPSGLFSSAPKIYAVSANQSWVVYGASATTSSISLRSLRNASNAAAMTINFYVVGGGST